MKQEIINYYISENYISHWTLEDAYREIHQNFKDYGEYENTLIKRTEALDFIRLSNSFNPLSTDLLIIGESSKDKNQIGKYGEGLKMAALVILRNKGSITIKTNNFLAYFILIDNTTTEIRTLGVKIITYDYTLNYSAEASFILEITVPPFTFENYTNTIIKPENIIHHREYYGSIVNKEKENLYIGGLFVCKLNNINYAYDIYPKNIELDRDRKVPRDWDVKYNIGKIQETFEQFDKIGKTVDVQYSTIPEKLIQSYTAKPNGDKITFVTKITNEEGKEEEVEVSDNFNNQLIKHSYFSNIIFKLKSFITTTLGIKELAINFKNKYCNNEESLQDFKVLMYRLGIVFDDESKEDLPF